MRWGTFVLSVVLVVGLASPAFAAPPPEPPAAGWTVDGSRLVWRADAPVPVGDSAVEFWEGDRLLGRPTPSADHRTFTLRAGAVRDPRGLAVKVGGRRLDIDVPAKARKGPAAPLPDALPAGTVDPGKPGPFATRTGEYSLDAIQLPDYPAAVEMDAVVVAPVGAPGKRPLALFLHGRHVTCYEPGVPENVTLEWPCPAGMKSIPSYRGYLQAQELLASQGYVTVSISANGVNGQDNDVLDLGAQGRSSLVREHLTRWAGRGGVPAFARNVDLSKVLLVGHSRGGEGVNQATLDTLNPPPGDPRPARWKIRGTLLIGPTIFGINPAPDVPSITILPGCDGDVADLQGEQYVDATRGVSRGAALHSALYFYGANHNFFNTEWTPGQSEAPSNDDVWDTEHYYCAPGKPTRLTPEHQQTAGATYIAAAARLFVAGDERVLPLVDGSGVRAPSADPVRVLSHAVGGARTPFVVPAATTTATDGARLCRLVTLDATERCTDTEEWAPNQPHVATFWGVMDDPDRFAVALTGAAGTVRPAKPVSLAGSRDLALRVIVPPNTTGNRIDVAITDTSGRRAQLGSATLDGLPADGYIASLLAQEVRVPLPRNGIDLRHIASLELAGSGEAWLVDAHGWRGGLPDPKPVVLPRTDIGEIAVEEGDTGTKHYEVTVTVGGGRGGALRLFVGREDGTFTTRLVDVRPGRQTIELPYDVAGDTRWGMTATISVYAKGITGVVAADYVGGITVIDDDPAPTVSITPAATTAEGGTLTWDITMSAPAEFALTWYSLPIPGTEPELSTTDVDPEWFTTNAAGEDPLPSRPLVGTQLFLMAEIPPGELTTSVSMPTVLDGETEPTEHVRLLFLVWELEVEVEVTGTLTEAG